MFVSKVSENSNDVVAYIGLQVTSVVKVFLWWKQMGTFYMFLDQFFPPRRLT